jgi:hypothetical protein
MGGFDCQYVDSQSVGDISDLEEPRVNGSSDRASSQARLVPRVFDNVESTNQFVFHV